MDGTVSGEHGIGLKLRDELIEELGSSAVDMMRRVCFHGIMSSGVRKS